LSWLLFLPGATFGQQTPGSSDDVYGAAAASNGGSTYLVEPPAPPPFASANFAPNWKSLVSAYVGGKGSSDITRNGFFFGYDRLIVSTSPEMMPIASTARAPNGVGDVRVQHSGIAWENSLPHTTESLASKIGGGNRIEFGRMVTDNTGWMVSAFDQVSSSHETQVPDDTHVQAMRPK